MNNFTKSAFILILITLLSKIFGFCRELTLTYFYGASAISDVYITSVSIPTILFSSFSAALATTFIPIFYEIDDKSRKESIKFTNNVVNLVVLLSITLIIISFIFTEQLVKVFAINFDEYKLNLAIKFTRVMMFGILFTGINNIMTSWLQVNNQFVIPSITVFPYNIILILSIFISYKTDEIFMVLGTILAMFTSFIVSLVYSKKYGYRYKLYINIKDKYIKDMLLLLMPMFIGIFTSQLNAILDRSLASTLEDGSITILNSANKLNGLFISIFISTISSVLYPVLSRMSNDNNTEEFKRVVFRSINIVIITIIPISIATIVLSEPFARITFERGAFDHYDTKMTAIALSCYSMGMIGFSLRDILIKIFYSVQDTKTPMINGILSVVINMILNISLIKFLSYAGLALATSISSIITVIMLLISLEKKIGYFSKEKILLVFLKVILSSLIMGIVLYISYNTIVYMIGISFITEILALVLSSLLGIITYIISIITLGGYDIGFLINEFRKRINR